jgi:hypothetical protein
LKWSTSQTRSPTPDDPDRSSAESTGAIAVRFGRPVKESVDAWTWRRASTAVRSARSSTMAARTYVDSAATTRNPCRRVMV